MSQVLPTLAPTLLMLILAGTTTYFTGGAFRGAMFMTSDERMQRVARVTWWVSPAFVTTGGVFSALAMREFAAAAALMCGAAGVCAALSWMWRPSRAPELWSPRWITRLRSAVDVPLRDAAAWRRQGVELVVAVVVLVVPLAVLCQR